ncbi:MAG: hypothetical protein V7L05_00610 [Nostoc sp.]|uniref:hypothetical protein n=1 Tax=Nostoc sp. TaxID=1180 RepID=UPI002FF70414
MPNAQCPMPNAPCPMPNAPCPMPNAQCPMPNAQYLMDLLSIYLIIEINSQLLKVLIQNHHEIFAPSRSL